MTIGKRLRRLAQGPAPLHIRPATGADRPALENLAGLATRDLLGPFLSAEQRAVTSAFTPLDPWLIADGTYYVAEIDGEIRASGGWSWRSPMIHDPNAHSQAPESLAEGAARIRAMYTDPDHARMGLGRTILSVCELSARMAGMRRLELVATPVGELLYRACGYECVETVELEAPGGVVIPVARMQKDVSAGVGLPHDTDRALHRACTANSHGGWNEPAG